MKFLLSVIMFFLAGMSFGQEALSKIPASGSSIMSFIPKDYDTLMTAKGDLNKDSVDDYVLVLKSVIEDKEEAKFSDSLPQRLLIVLLKSGNEYKLAVKADSAIMCKECGGVYGDPFAGISIKKGVLTFDYYGGSAWRWELTYKFRYQKGDFYLIGTTDHSYWNVKMCDKLNDFAGTDLMDINLLTGAYVQKKISEECKLVINKKGKQKVKPLLALRDFKIDN